MPVALLLGDAGTVIVAVTPVIPDILIVNVSAAVNVGLEMDP
jgi:hypothetical protein